MGHFRPVRIARAMSAYPSIATVIATFSAVDQERTFDYRYDHDQWN
jgi:hypothetical protein